MDEAFEREIVEDFKWFHENPERSYEEYKTTEKIREVLEKYSIDILDVKLETGLLAKVGKGPRKIALRADIDALPVNEETDLPYKSKVQGTMHACGHDFHTAELLGVAKYLKDREEELDQEILLIFQPAEESSLGALKIVETKILDGIEYVIGGHADSTLPVGTIGISSGPVTAAVDRFEINLKGYGTHASQPDSGKDPLIAASALHQSLQTIVSRNVYPFDPAVLSVTHIEGGTSWNIIPEEVFMEGTVRTMTEESRKLVKDRLFDVSENIGKAYQVDVDVNYIDGPAAVDNDEDLAGIFKDFTEKEGLKVAQVKKTLGGEDFSFLTEGKKGLYYKVGTGISYPHHHPKFQVSPDALIPGIKLMGDFTLYFSHRIEEKKND